MRQFFKSYRMVRTLTQGSIINNCIADNYAEGLDVYGLIITPRCDLAHEGKVNTVHYLPIVDFDDWLCCDGEAYLLNKWAVKNKYKFEQLCKKHNIPSDLKEKELYVKIAERIFTEKSQRTNFLEKVDVLFCSDMQRHKAFEDYCHKEDTRNTLISNLLKDELPAYYLIDDWDTARATPKIILLRELKRISYETSQKIGKGMYASDVKMAIDELKEISPDNEIYHVCAEVNSPFIEHIMQKFSHNFCRIGVDDRDFIPTFEILSNKMRIL